MKVKKLTPNFEVENIKEITEPKLAWYGMNEFYAKDPNGYILGFAEKSE